MTDRELRVNKWIEIGDVRRLKKSEGLSPIDEEIQKGSSEHCHASSDGDCAWKHCPQSRDNEPEHSRRSCPLESWEDKGR